MRAFASSRGQARDLVRHLEPSADVAPPHLQAAGTRLAGDLDRAAISFVRGDGDHARELLRDVETTLTDAGIVLDPDDAYEVDWLRAGLYERRIGATNREGAPCTHG